MRCFCANALIHLPVEVDPDTDEEETKTDEKTTTLPEGEGKVDDVDDDNGFNDPTTRPWTKNEETSRSLFSLLRCLRDTHPLPSLTQLLRPRWRYPRNSGNACFNRPWQ